MWGYYFGVRQCIEVDTWISEEMSGLEPHWGYSIHNSVHENEWKSNVSHNTAKFITRHQVFIWWHYDIIPKEPIQKWWQSIFFYHLLCVCLCVCVCTHVHRMQRWKDARYQHQMSSSIISHLFGGQTKKLAHLAGLAGQQAPAICLAGIAITNGYTWVLWMEEEDHIQVLSHLFTNTLPIQHLPSSLK